MFLILAICASVLVSVFLKIARWRHIDIAQAILVNYITAIMLCLAVLSPDFGDGLTSVLHSGTIIFVLLGVLLPSVFIIMAKAVNMVGIAKSDTAQRLALFLPILASFTIFGEILTFAKGVGIVLAFLSLMALSPKPDIKNNTNNTTFKNTALILGGVWFGYGVIDILFKQMSKLGGAFPNVLLISFILAFISLFIYLIIQKTRWHAQSLISGVILGILNFCNILFYIKAHQAYKDDPTLVFAGMNIGVICLGVMVGVLIFKEKLNNINILGILSGVCAVWCLFYLA